MLNHLDRGDRMNIKLEVSEPWDFTGPDGPNLILAQLVLEGTGKFGDWVICNCKPFTIKGISVSNLLLSLRHFSKNLLISQLKQDKKVMVNAYWRRTGNEWDAQTVINAETDSSLIGGWLIATVQRVS